ncbi:MAG: VanW family protein [Deltaproteobacteria bacterium]
MALEKWKTAALLISMTVLGICIAVIIYFYQVFYTSDRFLPGVEIAGVPVAGLTSDQAAVKLTQALRAAGSAPVIFYHDSYSYQTSMDQLVVPFDARKAVRDVWAREKARGLDSKMLNLDGAHKITYPQKIIYRPGTLSQILKTFNDKMGVKTVDATLDVDPDKGLVVVPGSPGEVVDVSALMESLPREWEELEELRIGIVMVVQKPRVTEEDLKGMGELSSFSTWFNTGDINRSANLRLAARTLNGTMVKPGEIISFNNIIGPRTAETGFNEALTIVGGKFVPGIGGGICQVSTTLYNAVLLAGLNIVERNQHNMAVAYVPLGRDATVSYGSQDFRFQNNTDSPIYIRAVTSGGIITINVYGDLEHKQKIAINSVIDGMIPFKKVDVFDDTLAPGEVKVEHTGINGYSVRAFRSFYDANGKLINQELLSTNNYLTLDEIIHHGPSSNLPVEPVGEQTVGDQPEGGAQEPSAGGTGNSSDDAQPPAPDPADIISDPTI